MKSTYNLLSIFLDKQALPIPTPRLIALSQVPECPEIEEEYTLFDFPVCKRKISGIKLLSTMSADDIPALLNQSVNYHEIIVLLDYDSISQVACTLYLKRVLQAITFLSKSRPEARITLAGNIQQWKVRLNALYQSEHNE